MFVYSASPKCIPCKLGTIEAASHANYMLPTCVATGLNSTFKARLKQGEDINVWPISDRQAVLNARVRFLLPSHLLCSISRSSKLFLDLAHEVGKSNKMAH